MSSRARTPGDNALLGMIVDRSSFDDEELTQTQSDDERSSPIKRRNGKVRRKLRWKPPAFRSSRRKTVSSNNSVVTERSGRSFGSFLSFHTFHSTATPVIGNKKSHERKPLARPNYRDTFDGMATIDNEGGYVHSRMAIAHAQDDPGFPRSQTLPTTDTDFEAIPVHGPDFDPYGTEPHSDPLRFSRKRKGSRNRPGRPPMAPPTQRVPSPDSLRNLPEPLASKTNVIETSTNSPSIEFPVESSMSLLSTNVLKTDSHIGLLAGANRTAPTVKSNSFSVVTPSKAQFGPERNLIAGGPPTPSSRKKAQMPKVSPAAEPVKAEHSNHSPSALPDLTSKTSVFSIRRPGRKYNRPVDSTALGRSHFEAPRGRSNSVDSLSSTDSTPRAPSPRSRTGPVDTDDGSFLEAERNLNAIHQMASEHLSHGEYAEALEVFEEILRGHRERYGPKHSRVGTALHNIGIVHLKTRSYKEAVEVCREAVDVRRETLGPNHPDVAVSLAQLGVAHLESNKHREALCAFREALEIRKSFLGHKHPKVGKILNNVGCALFELDEMEGAELAFEEALEIQRETLRSSPPLDESASSNQSLLSIASSLCNLGSIRQRKGEYEEASVALEEALLIQQSVLGDDHPTVLITAANIHHVDNTLPGSFSVPLGEMVRTFGCGTSPHYMPSSVAFGTEASALKCSPTAEIASESFSFTRALGLIKEVTQERASCGGHTVDDEASKADSSVRDLGKDNRVEV